MTVQTTLAERLAAYATTLRYEDLPPEIVHDVKRVVIDSLGCALTAWNETPCKAARSVVFDLSARKGSTVFGTSHQAPPDWAAFHNCLCVRFNDYNDTYLSKEPAHPSDNIAAAIAAAESSGASCRELIAAIVIAYEIQCRFCDAASIRARGWDHVTYGAFSVACAASRLFSLDAARTRHAVGIAGVASAALRQSRVGELSHWKGAAFANAARHGIYAAMLARAGMTGPAPIFEGEKGFELLVSGPLRPEGPFAEDGGRVKQRTADDFMLRKCYIKYYPAEYHAQSAVAAALELRSQLQVSPGATNVESVLIQSHDAAVDIIGSEPEKWRPTHRETADHSLPYMVAAALADGELTARQFETSRFTNEALLDVVARVRVERHAELSAMYPDAVGNIVTVRLKNGQEATLRINYPPGHAKNRLGDDGIEKKFRSLAEPVLGRERADRLLDWAWKLDSHPNVSGLFPLLQIGGN